MVLAPSTTVSGEAFAKTGAVVADTTAGAVASTEGTLSGQRIGSGKAFNQRAVGSTESSIALASKTLVVIPSRAVFNNISRGQPVEVGTGVGGVHVGNVIGELELGLAHTVAGAVVGASGTAATFTGVSVKALASTGLAVADTLAGAFGLLGVVVVSNGTSSPNNAKRASAKRAVGSGPGKDKSGRSLLAVGVINLSSLAAGVASARVLGKSGGVVSVKNGVSVHIVSTQSVVSNSFSIVGVGGEDHFEVVAASVATAGVRALGGDSGE